MKTILRDLWNCRDEIVRMIGLLVFAGGLTNVVGFVCGKHGYSYIWRNSPPMAVETAALFTLTGIGLIILSQRINRLEAKNGTA